MKNDAVTWLLIVLVVLTISIVSLASEPELSIYDAPSDKTKSIVECSWSDGSRPDQRLVIKTKDLDNNKVTRWFLDICVGRDR